MTSLTQHYRSRLTASKLLSDPELLLTSPEGFGLVNATPLQRAIACVLKSNSMPDRLWADTTVQAAFGGYRPTAEEMGGIDELGIVAGIRGGKTLMASMGMVFASQNVDLEHGRGQHMVAGEVPRVSLVSVSVDQSEAAYNYIRGALTEKPALKHLLIGEPTVDTITVRHPTGRPIEICVVAGSKAGSSLVGRWCAGVIFDEAPLMALGEGGVRDIKDMVTNVRPRMLSGARIMYIGSPWGNSGFIYDLFHQSWGKRNPVTVFIKAQGDWLNPVAWSEAEQARVKAKDEKAYRLNFLAEFMDPESSMYSSVSVDNAMKRSEVVRPPDPTKTYTAAIDPGMSSNSWTFGIAETEDNVRYDVVLAKQWTGSGAAPLVAGEIFDEMLPDLLAYRCTGSVKTDQWAAMPLVEIALTRGIGLSPLTITKANKFKLYASVGVRLDSGYLSLPPIPEVRQDLLNVKKRITGDGVKVILPETADGRHCDYAAMLALLVGDYLQSSAEVMTKADAIAAALDELEELEEYDPYGDEEMVDNRDDA